MFQVNGHPQLPPATATLVPGATATDGSGLAIAFDGSLRFSDGNTVKSSPTGFSASTVSTEDLIVGLGVANGGDGSAVTSLSIGAVCASTSNTILCAPKTGGTLSAFAVFEADEDISGFRAVLRIPYQRRRDCCDLDRSEQ